MAAYFIFQNGRILLKDGGLPPDKEEAEELAPQFTDSGHVDKETKEGDSWASIKADIRLPDFLTPYDRRSCWQLTGEELFFRIAKAFHQMDARARSRFCGRCGAKTVFNETEGAMAGPACGELFYPVICPAIIVSVVKEGKILLGHGVNFPPGRYSVLAGFVEPGESLEDCVRREVFEESRIKVKNIKYFKSQPWAFPRSLMLGFTAEWESGEPSPERSELTDVRWFAPEEIPDYYRGVSISAKLIENFVAGHAKYR